MVASLNKANRAECPEKVFGLTGESALPKSKAGHGDCSFCSPTHLLEKLLEDCMKRTNSYPMSSKRLVGTFVAALSLTLLTACDRDPRGPPQPTTSERIDDTNRAPTSNLATPLPPSQQASSQGSEAESFEDRFVIALQALLDRKIEMGDTRSVAPLEGNAPYFHVQCG